MIAGLVLLALVAAAGSREPVCFFFHVPCSFTAQHLRRPLESVRRIADARDRILVSTHGQRADDCGVSGLCTAQGQCELWHATPMQLKTKPRGHRYSSLNRELPYGEPQREVARVYRQAALRCEHEFLVNMEPDCIATRPLRPELLGDYVAHRLEFNVLPGDVSFILDPTADSQLVYSFTCGTVFSRRAALAAFSHNNADIMVALTGASTRLHAQDMWLTALMVRAGFRPRFAWHVNELHEQGWRRNRSYVFIHGEKQHYPRTAETMN